MALIASVFWDDDFADYSMRCVVHVSELASRSVQTGEHVDRPAYSCLVLLAGDELP